MLLIIYYYYNCSYFYLYLKILFMIRVNNLRYFRSFSFYLYIFYIYFNIKDIYFLLLNNLESKILINLLISSLI